MAEIKITFTAADDYERFMGRWNRAVGEKFLAWLNPAKGAPWLDVGCGTGAFSEPIVTRCVHASIAGLDPSSEQIDYVRELLPSHRFEVADATAMPFRRPLIRCRGLRLGIHFIPDRAKAFAEKKRVLRPGGLVGGYTWKRTENSDFAAYAPILRAAERVGGVALWSAIVPEGSVDGMRGSLQAAGFADAEAVEIEVT